MKGELKLKVYLLSEVGLSCLLNYHYNNYNDRDVIIKNILYIR